MRIGLLLCGALLCAAGSSLAQEGSEVAPVSVDELLRKAVVAYQAGLDGESRDARLEGFRRAELLFADHPTNK